MRKIAMIGTAGSGAAAPYDDLSFEIWGVSSKMGYVTRTDRWFELHRLEGEPPSWAKLWREALSGFIGETPLYMIYPESGLAKNVVQYPYQKMVDRFGTYHMTSTFSWMMALALDEMAPLADGRPTIAPPGCEIAIYGVDMEYGSEYRQQRGGFRHFIALAKQLGIAVTRLADGGLSYEPVPYPMWQDDPLLNKIEQRKRHVAERLKSHDATIRETHLTIAQNAALIEALENDKIPDIELLKKERAVLKDSVASLSRDIVAMEATLDEQNWILDYLTP